VLLLSISIAVVIKKQGRAARIMRAPKTLRFNGRSALEGHLAALNEIVSKASLVSVEATDA
jgi:D-serine deaminase-like pyridoxal phosphate-dependent protein